MTELKPCPFCGRKPDVATLSDGFTIIECIGARMHGVTEEEAISNWNTRYERTCHIVMVEECEWECDKCRTAIDWESPYEDDPPSCKYCPNCGAKVVKE